MDKAAKLLLLALAVLGVTPAMAWRSVLYPSDWQPPVDGAIGFETNKLIQDFSYAGYKAGEAVLPTVTGPLFDVTQSPYNADKTGISDATTAIQSAINTAQSAGGGVVFLPAGLYSIRPLGQNAYALLVNASNVVLRGAGVGQTYLLNTSTNMRSKSIILVSGLSSAGFYSSGVASAGITRDVLGPATVIPVASTSGFTVGQSVVVRADCTDAWITEHGEPDWIGDGSTLKGVAYFRKVVAVSGVSNTITINAPTRYYLKTRDNARVVRLGTGPLIGCGLENFSIGNVQCNGTGWGEDDYTISTNAAYEVHDSFAIRLVRARDSWVRSVATFQASGNTTTSHLLSNGILLSECTQVTLTNCDFQHAQYGGGGGNGYMYRLANSAECLVDNCRSTFTRHGFVLSSMGCSGNVFHECVDKDSGRQTGDTGLQLTAGSNSDHHMHFSHANLVDACTGDNSSWEARYRPYGSVPLHDLTAAHSVYWNARGIGSGASYVVQSEQSRYGYVIGTRGTRSGVSLSTYGGTKCNPVDHVEGTGLGDTLQPYSLYADQLTRRLSLPKVTLPTMLNLAFPSNSVQLQPVVEIGSQAAATNTYTANWSVQLAPGGVFFSDSNAPVTMATFAERGTNVIKLTVTANGFQTEAAVVVVLAPDDAAATETITPVADAYVRDGTFTNDNYGAETVLQLKKNSTAGYTRRAFLGFNLSGVTLTNFSRAFLELTSVSAPAAGLEPTLELHPVTNDSWSESGMTWGNQPAMGATITNWPMSTNGLDRVETTSVARAEYLGDGLLSFGLLISAPFSDTVYSFNSREAGTAVSPRLVLEVTNVSVSFASWIAGFTDLASPANAPDSDPDGDRLNNAEEYLFGSSPSQADSARLLGVATLAGGLTMTFPCRKHLPAGTYFVIETTPMLWPAAWKPAPGVQFSSSAGQTNNVGTMTALIPADTGQRAFYRLRIVLGP